MARMTKEATRQTGTLLCIVGMVAAWICMGLIVKDDNPKNYYFMAYVVHGGFSVFLLPWAVWVCLQDSPRTILAAYNWKRNWQVASVLALLTILVSYLWYQSLPLTPLAANTAIYNSSSAFVLVLSSILLGQPMRMAHCLCVLLSVCGIALTSLYAPREAVGGGGTILGYLLVLASTLFYALFEVLYKKWDVWEQQMKSWVWADGGVQGVSLRKTEDIEVLLNSDQANDTSTVSDDLPSEAGAAAWGGPRYTLDRLRDSTAGKMTTAAYFTGLIGFCIYTNMWPGLLLMHFTGWEPIIPESSEAWTHLIGLTLFTAVYDSLLLASISLSNPLLVSLGTIMTVPVSLLVDWLVRDIATTPLALLGAVLIVASFVGITMLSDLH